MGRTIGKTCARCGRLNYVDVDAEMFTCPGCGARVEIYDEDREVVDKAMEKIIVPGKKESHLYEKAEKAIYTKGPAFLNVLSPCPRGWGYPTEDLMVINKLAVDTCYWPLYEVIDGVYKISYKPANKLPIEEFLKPQRRFKHMFKPGNEWMIEAFQKEVDERWEALLRLEEITNRE
jgi:hypothetical protein